MLEIEEKKLQDKLVADDRQKKVERMQKMREYKKMQWLKKIQEDNERVQRVKDEYYKLTQTRYIHIFCLGGCL